MDGQVAVAMLVKCFVMVLGIRVKHEDIRVVKAYLCRDVSVIA